MNIYMMPASAYEIGTCWVCERNTTLKSLDAATGKRVGDCCLRAIIQADCLLMAVNKTGIRAPLNSEIMYLEHVEGRTNDPQ